MDFKNGYRALIFMNSVLVISGVPSYHNETYNGYTLIMPLTNGGTNSPLTLPSSLAKEWCSSIGATSPRITDESDQGNIVQFIRSAVREYKLNGTQNIFINNINHAVGNWTWVNGQTNQGFKVKGEGADGYFFGYLWTNDFRISESLPLQPRRYICEKSEHSSNSFHCEIKLGKRCYWKKDEPLTWYKARNACLNEGGDLASFGKLNENILKVSLNNLGLTASKSYWVGIYKGVWQWNDEDSEIKYSNWKDKHPSNYDAKCLCLDKQPNDYEWIECECDKSYPLICKRNDTSDSSTAMSASEVTATSAPSPLPIDQVTNTSVISETFILALVLGSCGIIVVVIILVVAVFIIRKHRNRLVNSSRDGTSEARTTTITNEFPLYAEIEEPTVNQSTVKCSASDSTYANVQFAPKTNNETSAEHIVYTELDLLPNA